MIKEDTCLTDLIDGIVSDIIERKTSIFFGAGISIGSGNLSADAIRNNLLLSLEYDGEKLYEKSVIDSLGNRTKQFEDFLNRIYADVNDPNKVKIFAELFNILYDSGNPNFNHHLIAYLLDQEYLKKVYTTNFDLHLEKAYEDRTGEELTKWISGEDIDNSAQYVKLHGCISNVNEIRTLLNRIAKQKNLNEIRPIMERFLVEGEHENVLFLGYSFSDVYDIVKIILEISKERKDEPLKEIYIIAHTIDREEYDIYSNFLFKSKYEFKTLNEYNNSLDSSSSTRKIEFDNFKIMILKYDTNSFIQALKNKFGFNINYDAPNNFIKSEIGIKNWADELDDYYRLLIGWRFNYEAGQEYFISLKGINKFINKFKILNKFIYKRDVRFKALHKALEYCDIILEVNESNKDIKQETKKRREILNKKHKAVTLISLGLFKKARDQLEEILKEVDILTDENWKMWLRLDLNGQILNLEYFKILIGNFSKDKLIKFIKEKEEYYKSLNVDRSIYNNHLVNYRNQYLIATLKNHLKISEKHDEMYFVNSIEFYENDGHVEYLAFVYMEYAKYLHNNNESESYDIMEMSRELFKNLGYEEYLQFCVLENK